MHASTIPSFLTSFISLQSAAKFLSAQYVLHTNVLKVCKVQFPTQQMRMSGACPGATASTIPNCPGIGLGSGAFKLDRRVVCHPVLQPLEQSVTCALFRHRKYLLKTLF